MSDVTFTAHEQHGLRITSGSRKHARSDSLVLAVCTKRLGSWADHRGCHSLRSSKPSFEFADIVQQSRTTHRDRRRRHETIEAPQYAKCMALV
jgi:hypothetical protein